MIIVDSTGSIYMDTTSMQLRMYLKYNPLFKEHNVLLSAFNIGCLYLQF